MATTYLSRTQSSGNRKTFTISTWVKRSAGFGNMNLIMSNVYPGIIVRFVSTDETLQIYDSTSGFQLRTNAVYRDVNAWYHFVFAVDTTQATSSDRVKMYVNGEQITSFQTETYPSLNADTDFNNGLELNIGREAGQPNYFDGLMSHFHVIDGTAYDASTFGETDATTGIWKPKTAPSVTYGTNGFFLKFENSGAFGTDSSGNANNFTVNGTMTQTIDTPSNVFATANPLHFSVTIPSAGTLSNGNLTFTSSQGASAYPVFYSTMAVSKGKYYAEFKVTTADSAIIGIGSGIPSGGFFGGGLYDYGYYYNGTFYNNGGNTGSQSSYTDGDIISVAMDLDNNKVYVAKNNTWQHSGDPSAGTGGYTITAPSSTDTGVYHIVYGDIGSGTPAIQGNFGNGYFGTTAVSSAENPDDGIGIFEYAVPTGYKALCTKSINAQEYS